MKTIVLLSVAAALATSGCAETAGLFEDPRPATEVRRIHSGQSVGPASVAVAPLDLAAVNDPVLGAYAGMVSAELAKLGFRPVSDVSSAQLLATVAVASGTSAQLAGGPPPALGWQTGLYPGAPATALTVEIKRRADGATLWQGRSVTTLRPQGELSSLAGPLARALFLSFPGESGRTISVR